MYCNAFDDHIDDVDLEKYRIQAIIRHNDEDIVKFNFFFQTLQNIEGYAINIKSILMI